MFDRLAKMTGRSGDEESAADAPEPEEGDDATPPAPEDLEPAAFRERAATLAGRSDVPELDFSEAALADLDSMATGSHPVEDPITYGSYLGETLVREYDGEWVREDGWAVAVWLGDDETTVAVFDAARMALERGPVFEQVADRLHAEGDPYAERATRPERTDAGAAAIDDADDDAGARGDDDDLATDPTADAVTDEEPTDDVREGDVTADAAEEAEAEADSIDEDVGTVAEGTDEDDVTDDATAAEGSDEANPADAATAALAADATIDDAEDDVDSDAAGDSSDGAGESVDDDLATETAAEPAIDEEPMDDADGDESASPDAESPTPDDETTATDADATAPDTTAPPEDATPSADDVAVDEGGGVDATDDAVAGDSAPTADEGTIGDVGGGSDGDDGGDGEGDAPGGDAPDESAASEEGSGSIIDAKSSELGIGPDGPTEADFARPRQVDVDRLDADDESVDAQGESADAEDETDDRSVATTADDAVEFDDVDATAESGHEDAESGDDDSDNNDASDHNDASDDGEATVDDGPTATDADAMGGDTATIDAGVEDSIDTGEDGPVDDGDEPVDGAGEDPIADETIEAPAATTSIDESVDGGAVEESSADGDRVDDAAAAGDAATATVDDDPIDATSTAASGTGAADEDDGDVGAGTTAGGAAGSTPMPSRSDYEGVAIEFCNTWSDRPFDYSPASLSSLDRFLDDQWAGRFRPGSLADTPTDPESGGPLVQVGAYVGEVLVRHYDGEWVAGEDGEAAVAVAGHHGRREVFPVFDVARTSLEGASRIAYAVDALANRLDLDLTASGAEHTGFAIGDEGPGSEASSADVITTILDRAETFVEEWSDYDLNYRPASLVRVDNLAKGEFDREAFQAANLGEWTDTDALRLADRAAGTSAYFAAVLVRHLDAQWEIGEEVALAVEGPAGETRVRPFEGSVACLRGRDKFMRRYDRVHDAVHPDPENTPTE